MEGWPDSWREYQDEFDPRSYDFLNSDRGKVIPVYFQLRRDLNYDNYLDFHFLPTLCKGEKSAKLLFSYFSQVSQLI
jgi:hypothetical protein